MASWHLAVAPLVLLIVSAGCVETQLPGAPTSGPVGGEPFSITMDTCQNQHGQGVAEGLIRNDDAVVHNFRVEVWFYDLNGTLLSTTSSFATSDLPPGTTARWQAVVASGLPSGEVTCQIQNVLVDA